MPTSNAWTITFTMETTLILIAFVAGLIAVLFLHSHFTSARIVKGWLATLANGDKIPAHPRLGWRFWLRPAHYEALAAMKTLEDMRSKIRQVEATAQELQFMQHFILGSLLEGVMVVNARREITLVNTEFLSIFQLQQSPLKRPVQEALGNDDLDETVRDVFQSGRVRSGRIRLQSQPAGRPPSFEMCAIPVKVSETEVDSVVVLILPPPDRPRMVQILKHHAEKVDRLADSWTARGNIRLRSSVADLPEPGESPVPASPETARSSFTS